MTKASEPAKPGSKLAAQLALGRRGGIRPAEEEARTPLIRRTGEAGSGAREVKPDPAPKQSKAVKPASSKPAMAVKPKKAKTVKRARKVLKDAEAKAEATAKAKPRKKPGPPKGSGVVGTPWLNMKPPISKAQYYRLRARGEV